MKVGDVVTVNLPMSAYHGRIGRVAQIGRFRAHAQYIYVRFRSSHPSAPIPFDPEDLQRAAVDRLADLA